MNRVNGSKKAIFLSALFLSVFPFSAVATAATSIPLTLTMSEPVIVTGTPRVAVDVGGQTRYAPYTAGSNTTTLTFTLTPQAGDVDLDGITISSPIDLNGGTLKDAAGNNTSLTFTPPNTSGIKVNYPSLGMDFTYDADGRYSLNGTVYNDLTSFLTAASGTFTRASIGTYYDSAGTLQTATNGTPRFDWDPVTHTAKGLLIEESRTNFIKSSESFSGIGWTLDGAILATGGTSPNGVSNATSISLGTGNNRLYTFDNSGVTGSKIFSIYLKQGAGQVITIAASGGQSPTGVTTIDLSTHTASGTNSGAMLSNYGGGWYRVQIPVNVTVASGNSTYWTLRNTGSSVYIWGAQLESGTFSTSYIPTTTAAVTRAADVLSIPSGAWLDGSKGTLYFNGASTVPAASIASGIALTDGSIANYVSLNPIRGAYGKFGYVRTAGADIALLQSGAGTSGQVVKEAIAFTNNRFAFSVDGTSPIAQAAGAMPNSLSVLSIGWDRQFYLNGNIKAIKYYPAALSNTQLQLLTQ